MSREKKEEALLNQILMGNASAVDFCQRIFRVSQILDDLIDRDRPMADSTIKLAFWDALVELPANPFYRQHMDYLLPIVSASFLDWEDATDLEKTSDHGKNIAFVLRDSIGQIVLHCAMLIGGREHARKYGVQWRKFLMNESLYDYKSELEQ